MTGPSARGAGPGGLDVTVVGSINADLVIRVPRPAAVGETILGEDLAVHPGGKGANQAVAVARLGGSVGLVGAVGSDAHGALLLDSLRGAGVRTDRVRRLGRPTGVALITVYRDGDNSIVVSPGANAAVTADDVAEAAELLGRAAVCCLQCELDGGTVAAAAREARGAGTRVVLNLAPPALLPADVLALADPLVVNEHEARYLLGAVGRRSGDAPPDTRSLRALGPASVVLTLGAAGALVDDGDGDPVRLPAPRVRAVDTTGAGDAFTGALALRLARGARLADAAGYAVRVASASVRHPGAQGSFPTAEEVDAL